MVIVYRLMRILHRSENLQGRHQTKLLTQEKGKNMHETFAFY